MAEKLTMEFGEKPEMNAVLAIPKGQVDVFSYKDFSQSLDNHTKDSPLLHLVIDMSGVEYVGSSGWSVLFVQSDNMDKKGGSLVLCAMTDRVKRSLDLIMPKKRVLKIAKDLGEAAQVLAGSVTPR